MTDPTSPPPLPGGAETPPAAAPAPPAKLWQTPGWQKFQRWFLIACAAIIGLLGLLKLYNVFMPQMPRCEASETTDLIRSIFKKKDIDLAALNAMTPVTETSSERNCRAHIETSSETATIEYRITMQGKEFTVLITKVDATRR
jgi:hypothetical protein